MLLQAVRRVFADSDGETSACGAPQDVNEVGFVRNSRHKKKGGRRNAGPPSEMVAGGGFEPPTFGLCDLTQLSLRVGLYLHPVDPGCSPSSLYAFLDALRLGSVLPYPVPLSRKELRFHRL